MILVSRILTYIIPLTYFISALIWLLHPFQIYMMTVVLVLLTGLVIYLMLRNRFRWLDFINELIYPLLLILIGSAFLIFLSTNWEYFLVVVFLSAILLIILNDTFSRWHPLLGSGLTLDYRRQLVLSASLFFLCLATSYNLILYLNWSLGVVLLGVLICLSLLFLRLVNWKINKDFFLVAGLLLFSSLELYFVFYELACDVYLKALLISLNFLFLIGLVFKNYFNKLEQNYAWKEK